MSDMDRDESMLVWCMVGFVLAIVLCGCSPTDRPIDKSDLTTPGFRHYPPVPCLLVAQDGAASIVYIPDTEHPSVMNAGAAPIGSTSISFKLDNGILTEFNGQVDTGIASVISSATGLINVLKAAAPQGQTQAPIKINIVSGLYRIDLANNKLIRMEQP